MIKLEANETFASRYTLIERIGYGGFSEVWKVKRASGFVQAIKIFIRSDEDIVRLAREEFERMFHLNHPRILKATDFGQVENCAYLVMPFCDHGSALKQIGQADEKQLAKILLDISSGLAYLHNLEDFIIHQDIKPDNFLIDKSGNYQLSDFGISKKIKTKLSAQNPTDRQTKIIEDKPGSSFSGYAPPSYRPPETFDERSVKGKPIKASDIWALGASLHELATGTLPFGEFGGVSQKAGVEMPVMPEERFSKELNYIIGKCLSKETWNRPTAKELQGYGEEYAKTGVWPVIVPIEELIPEPKVEVEPTKPEPKIPIAEVENKILVPVGEKEEEDKKKFFMMLAGAVVLLCLVFTGFFVAMTIGDDPVAANREDDSAQDKTNTQPSEVANTLYQDDTDSETTDSDSEERNEEETQQKDKKKRDESQGLSEIENISDNNQRINQEDDLLADKKEKKRNTKSVADSGGNSKSGLENALVGQTINKPVEEPKKNEPVGGKTENKLPENPPPDFTTNTTPTKKPEPEPEKPKVSIMDYGKRDGKSFLRNSISMRISPQENISTENNQEGDEIGFVIKRDIKIDGSLVIASGTKLTGKIVEKNNPNQRKRAARLIINFGNLKLADGKSLKMRYLNLNESSEDRNSHLYLKKGTTYSIQFKGDQDREFENYIMKMAK